MVCQNNGGKHRWRPFNHGAAAVKRVTITRWFRMQYIEACGFEGTFQEHVSRPKRIGGLYKRRRNSKGSTSFESKKKERGRGIEIVWECGGEGVGERVEGGGSLFALLLDLALLFSLTEGAVLGENGCSGSGGCRG